MPRDRDPTRPGDLDRVFHADTSRILLWTAALLAFAQFAIWVLGQLFPNAAQGLRIVALALLAASPVMAWALRQAGAVRVTRTGIAAPDIRGQRIEMDWPSIVHVHRVRGLGFDYLLVSSAKATRDACIEVRMALSPAFRNACEVAGPDHPLNAFIRNESAMSRRPAGSMAMLLDAMFGDARRGGPADNRAVIVPTRVGRTKLALLYLVAGSVWLANELWGDRFFAYVRSLPDCAQMPYWIGLWLAFMTLLVAVSLVCARRGIRTLRSGQFPPPGTWVFFTTQVLRGRAATRKAWGQFAIAAFYTVMVVALCFVFGILGLVDGVRQCAST